MKYYAVKAGHKTGIYYTWDYCKAQISGYKGAIYKRCKTLSEAEDFLNEHTDTAKETADSAASIKVYIVGRFNENIQTYACGIVVVDGASVETWGLCEKDTLQTELKAVAGEILGAKAAMGYCANKGISVLHLYYNYDGIERWCSGEWKAKKYAAAEYKRCYDEYKQTNNLKVVFHKIEASDGNNYSNIAVTVAENYLQQN